MATITKIVVGICIAIPVSAILFVALLTRFLARARARRVERYMKSPESHILDLHG
jgi:H+/gluconate symporter-like permease